MFIYVFAFSALTSFCLPAIQHEMREREREKKKKHVMIIMFYKYYDNEIKFLKKT